MRSWLTRSRVGSVEPRHVVDAVFVVIGAAVMVLTVAPSMVEMDPHGLEHAWLVVGSVLVAAVLVRVSVSGERRRRTVAEITVARGVLYFALALIWVVVVSFLTR
jgi:hypothetical protein